MNRVNSKAGQSLIELIIGVTIGAILIGSAAILIAATLRASAQNKFIQAASFLGQEVFEQIAVYAEKQWYCPPGCAGQIGLYNLNKGPANRYGLSVAGGMLTYTSFGDSGSEQVTIDGTTYTRYFYVENVRRNASGLIVFAGGVEDPSTQRITSVIGWPGGGSTQFVRYVVRHGDRVAIQSDWIGGGTFPVLESVSVVTTDEPTNEFWAQTSIDFSSIPGSIMIQAP